jgi:hypothetical protein
MILFCGVMMVLDGRSESGVRSSHICDLVLELP